MPNSYPEGKEPVCPRCGINPIKTSGSKQCNPCRCNPTWHGSVSGRGDTSEITRTSTTRIKTLKDLIRVCEIDTEEWAITRWVCNKWDSASAHEGKATVTDLYQVKAWLTAKRNVIDAKAEIASLIADARKSVKRKPFPLPKRVKGGHLLEVAPVDLHLGKLAWTPETGHDPWDLPIAEQAMKTAIETLLARASGFSIEKVLFLVGNDLLHADTKQGTTTAGTQLDMDSRYHKVFRTARRLCTWAIDRLFEVAPVHVVMLPGNHDAISVYCLGDALQAFYRQQPGIVIDNEPCLRKYVGFGDVLLGFCHGDKGKMSDYPLLMATEQPELFGQSKFREIHTGHRHQTRTQESHGVRVRILPALCPPDAWHAEQGFTGNQRSAEAYIWHRTEGLVGTAIYTIPSTTKQGHRLA